MRFLDNIKTQYRTTTTTTTTTMRRIATNFAAANARSTFLLFIVLAVASGHDHIDHSELTTTTELLQTPLRPIKTPRAKYYPKNTVRPNHQQFIIDVDAQRANTSTSIIDFNFNERRMRVLSKSVDDISKSNEGILYWMKRDQRIQDNWALLYAQKLAIQYKVPLYVVFCSPSKVMDSYRTFKFMCAGLKKVELECRNLNMAFNYFMGNSTEILSRFVRSRSIGAIVVDFSPLRDDVRMVEELVSSEVGSEVPVFQVDAHNVIPCWFLADKQIESTQLMRNRVYEELDPFLTEFPPVIKHPYAAHFIPRPIHWKNLVKRIGDRTVQPLSLFKAGYIPAMITLNNFVKFKLEFYGSNHRLDPFMNCVSNLSPWLHFGHISAQRVILEVLKRNDSCVRGIQFYLDEILIRREQLENYCYYNSNYDSFEGGPSWGRGTLNEHRLDERKVVCTRDQFENGETRDFLWNAAHNQMIMEGKMHRFLRPYWAKRILEFSKTPEEAIATANYLNDKYSLDGNDPCGYGGVLWAITGLYDQTFRDRKIYGKIRYFNSNKMRTVFNGYAYINKYRGVVSERQIEKYAQP